MAESSISQDLKLPFYSFAVKVLPDRDAMEENEKLWNQALYKWQQVLRFWIALDNLAETLLQEQVAPDRGSISVVLRDSTTAIKCAQTLLQYFSLDAITFFWNGIHGIAIIIFFFFRPTPCGSRQVVKQAGKLVADWQIQRINAMATS